MKMIKDAEAIPEGKLHQKNFQPAPHFLGTRSTDRLMVLRIIS